jgi:hypothetical protein
VIGHLRDRAQRAGDQLYDTAAFVVGFVGFVGLAISLGIPQLARS